MRVKKVKKIYRLSRQSVKEGSMCDIREVEVIETAGGYNTRQSRRIAGLEEPDIRIDLVVYSESKSTAKIDRLCRKIRKAIEEYNGRKANEIQGKV